MALRELSLDSAVEMARWDAFIAKHPEGTPYHLSSWLRVLRDTYGFKPYLYALNNRTGDLSGILPFFSIDGCLGGQRFVSLPFSDYGGPLFGNIDEEKECLSSVIKRHARQARYIEIRSRVPEDAGFVRYDYYKRHVLSLGSSIDVLWRAINRKTIQYSIKKAEKCGVKIEEANCASGIAEFYRLNVLTRKKHGIPAQPKRYFEILLQEMIYRRLGFILLAIHESSVVAGSLFLTLGKGIHYKYNVSDPRTFGRITPNHYLTWKAAVKGLTEGYEFIDFGRTSPDNLGLMRYKAMWGAECRDAPYYYYPMVRGPASTRESCLRYRIATSVWRRMPLFVAEFIGPVVHRQTG